MDAVPLANAVAGTFRETADTPIRRATIEIELVGPRAVPMAWAANVLSGHLPINAHFSICAIEAEDPVAGGNAALAAWRGAGADWLLLWPVGQPLGSQAIVAAISAGRTATLGRAALIRRGEDDGGFAEGGWRGAGVASDPGAELAIPPLSGLPVAALAPDDDPALCLIHAIPTLGSTSLRWVRAAMDLRAPVGARVYRAIVAGYEVADARQRLAHAALRCRPRPAWLFFHGDDILPAPGDLVRLAKRAVADKLPCLAGVYAFKREPEELILYRDGQITAMQPGADFQPGAMARPDVVGLDFCLLRVDALGDLPFPMFRTRQGRHTEDSYFWSKWRGVLKQRPYVDTAVRVGHYDARTDRIF